MKKYFWSLGLFIVSVSLSLYANGQSSQGSKKIIIIRHGEKPVEGDNLSCQGLNRAMKLPAVLYKKFGVPTSVYVPAINTGKETSTARMYQTAMPLAIKYNLVINTKYEVEDAESLAQSLLKAEGTSLVIWEHKAIDNIVKALGVEGKLKWDSNDYDSIWIVTIKNGGAALTKDKEGLSPAAACQ